MSNLTYAEAVEASGRDPRHEEYPCQTGTEYVPCCCGPYTKNDRVWGYVVVPANKCDANGCEVCTHNRQ